MPKEGDLQVWWIPQIPMKAFQVSVKTVDEACLLLVTLSEYDKFQLKHKIKPDYSNAGGLTIFEDGDWVEWYDEKNDEYINDVIRHKSSIDGE